MPAALSMDLRVRVMDEVDRGTSAEKAAAIYKISAGTIYGWMRLRRETGTLMPRRGKTGPKPKLQGHRQAIEAEVRQNSGITLKDLKAKLGLAVGINTLCRALHAWGLVSKKDRCEPPSNNVPMLLRSVVGGIS